MICLLKIRINIIFYCPFLSFALSSCELSDEGRYLIMYVVRGAEPKNKLYYCDLETVGYKIEGTCT